MPTITVRLVLRRACRVPAACHLMATLEPSVWMVPGDRLHDPDVRPVSTVCPELHERFEAFRRRWLDKPSGRPGPRGDLSIDPAERPEGRRDRRLANHRRWPPGAGLRQVGDARGQA